MNTFFDDIATAVMIFAVSFAAPVMLAATLAGLV